MTQGTTDQKVESSTLCAKHSQIFLKVVAQQGLHTTCICLTNFKFALMTCPRDAWRHPDNTLKCPIESGLRRVAQARGQFADVSTLLSQDRERGVHPPARHITHDRFTEHLGETFRK